MTMRLLTYTSIILLAFFSCESNLSEENQSLKEQIEALKRENESLRNKSGIREVTVSEYQRILEEIDYNLRTIELNLIQVSSPGGRDVPVKQRIENRLSVIQKLIHNSNLKIRSLDENLDELRKSASDRSKEVLALEKVMKNAAKVLMNKEEAYNQKKVELEIEDSNLEKTYQEQLAITYELYQMINRAYYYKGTESDLKKLGILDQDGVFVGIAQVKILNATMADSPFELHEKDSKGSFLIDEKTVRFITSHPLGSYTIKKTPSRNVLTVKDKKSFWKNGNYLIVQTD